MTETGKPKWSFYPAWVILSAVAVPVAWALAWVPISLVSWVVGETMQVGGQTPFTEDHVFSYVLFPLLGLATGVVQFFLLRRILPRMGWWIGASVAGYLMPFLLGTVLSDSVMRLLGNGARVCGTVGFATMGGLIGLWQWTVLRRHLRHAGVWILVVACGWASAGFVTGAMLTDAWSVLAVILLPAAVASVGLWLMLDLLAGSRGPATAIEAPMSDESLT